MAAKPEIRVWRHNPPSALRITIERDGEERDVGPRGLLDLDEAAATAQTSVLQLRRAISRGDLKLARPGRKAVVSLKALADYIRMRRADAEDLEIARAREGERTIPAREVFRRLGL